MFLLPRSLIVLIFLPYVHVRILLIGKIVPTDKTSQGEGLWETRNSRRMSSSKSGFQSTSSYLLHKDGAPFYRLSHYKRLLFTTRSLGRVWIFSLNYCLASWAALSTYWRPITKRRPSPSWRHFIATYDVNVL